jgi:SAM-dependent methyltransferase
MQEADMELLRLMNNVIPDDHARQMHAETYLESLLRRSPSINTVLDLGCGEGRSVDLFRALKSDIRWVGLDIENSPEVGARTRSDAEFWSYDGVKIPFADDTFDLIYSHQVFEHVRYPELVLHEARRVLKAGGFFVGSTSQLEPFHSCSLWNYTPFGFKTLLEAAGFVVQEIRPGIDGPTLIGRRMLRRPQFMRRWFFRPSPLNWLLCIRGRVRGRTPREMNALQLLFCGQFTWLARKAEGGRHGR